MELTPRHGSPNKRPNTAFGNVKADVIEDEEPHFHRGNFRSVTRGSAWRG
jgi:hypothetical protein